LVGYHLKRKVLADYVSRCDLIENFTLLLKTHFIHDIDINYLVLMAARLLRGVDVEGLRNYYGLKDYNRLSRRSASIIQYYILMMEEVKKMPIMVDLSILADVDLDFYNDRIDLRVEPKKITGKKKYLLNLMKRNLDGDGIVYVTSHLFLENMKDLGINNFKVFIHRLENELRIAYKNINIHVLPIQTPLHLIRRDDSND